MDMPFSRVAWASVALLALLVGCGDGGRPSAKVSSSAGFTDMQRARQIYNEAGGEWENVLPSDKAEFAKLVNGNVKSVWRKMQIAPPESAFGASTDVTKPVPHRYLDRGERADMPPTNVEAPATTGRRPPEAPHVSQPKRVPVAQSARTQPPAKPEDNAALVAGSAQAQPASPVRAIPVVSKVERPLSVTIEVSNKITERFKVVVDINDTYRKLKEASGGSPNFAAVDAAHGGVLAANKNLGEAFGQFWKQQAAVATAQTPHEAKLAAERLEQLGDELKDRSDDLRDRIEDFYEAVKEFSDPN